jgi:hypothetical protein
LIERVPIVENGYDDAKQRCRGRVLLALNHGP